MSDKLVVIDTVPMIESAFVSIEAMEVFGKKILDSKLCPDHFFPKIEGSNKRDYANGNTAAVMMVLMQGRQLQLPAMTSLQHIIPVNGLLSIKGDAAKSMIFSSGKLKPDTWKEVSTGSIKGEDLEVTISATREDNGESLSRSFSIDDAKRAGLWVTQQMIAGQDGWKHKASAWWKYPQRMITYRALGFLSRDLFPDVLSGIYTTEEAIDMPVDNTVVIDTKQQQIVIPDKTFSQERSETMTNRASDKIDKLNAAQLPPAEEAIKQKPQTPEESYKVPDSPGPQPTMSPVMLNGTPGEISIHTIKEMMDMPTLDLLELIEQDGLMTKAMEVDKTKNTNKKLRTILDAHYKGDVVSLIAKHDPEFQDPLANRPAPEPEQAPEPNPDPEETTVPEPEETVPGEEDPAPNMEGSVPEGNKYGIEVSQLGEEGVRSFDDAKTIFEEISNIAGLDNDAFAAQAEQIRTLQRFKDREEFVFKAEKAEIDSLLNIV